MSPRALFTRTWFLALLAAALVVLPWVLRRGASFAGSDDRASDAIGELRPDYKPWAQPLWKPSGSSTESFLFALQAAAGAGFIGYYLGLQRGRREGKKD